MNNEKIQGSGKQGRVKNQVFNCNMMCKESCSAHSHIWTWEESLPHEGLCRSLFWLESQASDGHEGLNYDFVLLSQADRLMVQLFCPADSTSAYMASATPPRSGYFYWQRAKGNSVVTGRLCTPDQFIPDVGHRRWLQECKLHSSRATGECTCETTQLHDASQQGLYLKFWTDPALLCFSAASFAHLPSAGSSSLSISAACSSLTHGSAGTATYSTSPTETQDSI